MLSPLGLKGLTAHLLQSNLVNTDTKGTIESVRINGGYVIKAKKHL